VLETHSLEISGLEVLPKGAHFTVDDIVRAFSLALPGVAEIVSFGEQGCFKGVRCRLRAICLHPSPSHTPRPGLGSAHPPVRVRAAPHVHPPLPRIIPPSPTRPRARAGGANVI